MRQQALNDGYAVAVGVAVVPSQALVVVAVRRLTGVRRVWRVRSAELTDEPATRPPHFDLQQAWKEIVATLDEHRGPRHVAALVDPGIVRWLRAHFATRLTVGDAHDDGRIRVEIGFPSAYDDPARELSGYADGLEVLSPPEVRARMAELGALLVERHGA